jgi:hypothetical protein
MALDMSQWKDETLVEALIQYTHQLHGARPALKADIRLKRDIVKDEVLRRMANG